MADVKFLFKREGRVKVALDAGDDIDARLEKLVEVALDADAEDFETEDIEDGRRTVEVGYGILDQTSSSDAAAVQVPTGILAQAHLSVERPRSMRRAP